MTDLQLWEDPDRPGLVSANLRQAVRAKTFEELTEILEILKPYATGMMGEISPIMVKLYADIQRQRTMLVGAHLHAPVREPVVEAEVVEAEVVDGRVLGARVLQELTRLELEMGEGA